MKSTIKPLVLIALMFFAVCLGQVEMGRRGGGQVQLYDETLTKLAAAVSVDDDGKVTVPSLNVADTDVDIVDITGFFADMLPACSSALEALQYLGAGYSVAAYGVGTNYTLTATPAALDFGTTDPTITLTKTGTYRITARVQYAYAAATFTASRVVTTSIYRTNNTPGILTNGSVTHSTPIIASAVTATFGDATWQVYYTTTATDDAITLYGSIAVVPDAGALNAVSTNTAIWAERIY